jgi:hypothetical protein
MYERISGSPVEPLQWRRIFQLALASDVRGEDIGLQSACQDLNQAYVAVTRYVFRGVYILGD